MTARSSGGDDDARSVATVVPRELGAADEEDEEAVAEHGDSSPVKSSSLGINR